MANSGVQIAKDWNEVRCCDVKMRYGRFLCWKHALCLSLALLMILVQRAAARIYEIRPASATTEEEFEKVANELRPGDELVLHGGTYSQTDRRAVAVKG